MHSGKFRDVHIGVIIPAAGSGYRFGGRLPKQYCDLGGKAILVRSVEVMCAAFPGAPVIVAVDPQWEQRARELLEQFEDYVAITYGGSSRQESVQAALEHEALSSAQIIVVHDSVRPLVSIDLVRRVVDIAAEHGGAVPVVMAHDTVKLIGDNWEVESTLPRSRVMLAQTPQAFQREVLVEAYREAQRDRLQVTDDASAVEYAGYTVVAVEGEASNIKITTPIDFAIATALLNTTLSFDAGP